MQKNKNITNKQLVSKALLLSVMNDYSGTDAAGV